MRWIIAIWLGLSCSVVTGADSPRKQHSLDGPWKFAAGDKNPSQANLRWRTVTVPQAWEHHEGVSFDGIGWYRKVLDPIELKPGRRLLLHFDAVATHATVYWNGAKLGEHLGPWTPFRLDVTEAVRKNPKGEQIIDVRVDEKVGHNTQGFLPIIQPHFGGIWQSVKLMEVPEVWIDDLQFGLRGDAALSSMNVNFSIHGGMPKDQQVQIEITAPGSDTPFVFVFKLNDHAKVAGGYSVEVPMATVRHWSPQQTNAYRVVVVIGEDRWEARGFFRTASTKGDQFLLNGQPLSIRGVLNWGYYPPHLAPNPDPEVWRKDLRMIKSWGFNLMKCCLWMPPKRLLEIADEEGVLLWIEYPTWHPQLDQKHRVELVREYTEFYHHDGSHPSVILRSLTCETGHQADLSIIQELYDLGKQLVPGALIVDDSSWIEWNRVYDFFDDHPYGNNHTWSATLKRLKAYIEKKGTKPLALGEAIAADTWVNPDWIDRLCTTQAKRPGAEQLVNEVKGMPGHKQPYWAPICLEANRAWLKRMAQVIGQPIDQERLTKDSLRYAWLMRKYQIEAYRQQVPHGGYVVSVLRDFPLASMGLIGYDGEPKWQPSDWAWHGEHAGESDPWPKPPTLAELKPPADHSIKIIHTLDEKLLAELEAGAKMLLLPNGKEGSLPLRSHWFLRGGPWVNQHHPLIKSTPNLHELLVDHQHFDLAGDVVPDIGYLEEIDPILMLWDTHDHAMVQTHGLVFATRVGKGQLLVSALKHDGDNNTLGVWLKNLFLQHLHQGPPPRNGLKPETIIAMKAKLREKKLNLVGQPWRFKPDPENKGLELSWQKTNFAIDETWKPIKVGQHWEGQGYATLDGWAWYRLAVTLPKDWPQQDLYLHVDGADDYAEFYVNGALIGSMGDRVNKQTAFDDKRSFALQGLKPGDQVTLAVRVYDWYGAGGLHRPLWLSTVPRTPGPEVLK